MEAAKQLAARVPQLSSTVDQLTQEKTTLQQKLESTSVASTANRRTPDIEKALAVAQQERERLRAQLEETKATLATAEQTAIELKNARDTARQERALAEAAAKKSQADSLDANQLTSRVAELSSAVEQLTGDRASLQQKLDRLDGVSAENRRLPELEKGLAAAQVELASLKRENERLSANAQAELVERRAQVARLRFENSGLAQRLRDSQSALNRIGAGVGVPIARPSLPTLPVTARANVATVAVSASTGRFYTVVEGDTLTRISVRLLGTGDRWQEIYNANREVLRTQTAVRVGQRLRIP